MDAQHFSFQMDNFSLRLAESIKRSGLSRTEFADRVGVGTSALAKWISGKLTPKSEQLLMLAQAANVTMEWLLVGDRAGAIKLQQDRLDSTLALHKKLLPKAKDSKDKIREFWDDILEGEDELAVARGGIGGRPDLLVLADLLESSSKKLGKTLNALASAIESVEIVGGSDSKQLLLQRLRDVAASAKILHRRQGFLLSEIREQADTEEF